MEFYMKSAGIYVPDGAADDAAIARTTHMAISAHPDDIEIMAYHGILECFGKSDKGFLGVIVTNGSGSPRDDLYKDYTDEEMQKVRRMEQKKAAFVGEYCAQVFLDYTSSAVKDSSQIQVVADLKRLLRIAKPQIVYTHNLADKLDTHVAVTLRAIQAISELPPAERPQKLYGCEVWRDLDWLADADKIVLNVQAHENLAAALVGVFDSQICGGKRYDLATMGRRRAHASYHESHATDTATALTFAMDLTPLIEKDTLDVNDFIAGYIARFAEDVSSRIKKFEKSE
jgi:LmbE family N-acetylglucosaminyl deacetylase